MAIQFARIEIIGRSSGGNACRKGAYNARTIITDEKFNVIFNFSSHGDNVFHQILLPEGANAKYKDPKILMNEVERVEKRKNSQLLKDIVLALPDDKELTLKDRIEITHRLIEKRGWVINGLAVQIDIHEPHDGEKNWHAHLLIPTRRFTSDGLSLGAKAVDLNPDFKKAGGRAYIIPESEQIHEDLKQVINSYFIELGLDNRVDEISAVPQEHIGPVRMRAAINQAAIRNQERRQANIESIRDGRDVLARVTKNASVFSENDVKRVLKCIDNRAAAAYLFEAAMSDQNVRALYEADGERTGLYTTTYVQEEERKLLRLAGYVADAGNITKDADSSKNQKIIGLIEENSDKLSAEQKQCLSHLLLGDNGIRIMRGRAGAGKSYVLGKFASIASAHGDAKIIGLAPTHKARTGLDAIGYQDTDTIKGFLFKLYNGRRDVSRLATIVVDEAAMVGNDDYNELLRVAASYKCNVILAGDEKQLASVGRGGMFEILADKYAGVNLLQIQRQDSSWGRSVAMNMSGGHFREGVAILELNNKLYEQNDGPASMEQLLKYWNASSFSLENKLILAVANSDVDALNAGARELLKSRGVISGDEYKIGDDFYMRGDRIVIKESSKTLNLSNGEFGKIIEAEADKFTILLDNGHKASFNPNEYQGFRHGYASTVYKAQGASIKDVYVYHSGFAGSRNSYVALSRHVKDIGLYINKKSTGSTNQLVRQLAQDLDHGASINYKTADEFNRGEYRRDMSMLGKVKTYAKEQFTGILDKYVPSSKYYRFEAPEQSMEQVERVLVRNDNIMIEAEKMVVGGRSEVGQKAIHVGVAESSSMNAASEVVMEKQTPKQRFYANADRQRGITGANSRSNSRDAGNSAAEYEARKEQWNRESELLRMEIKYKAEQIATDLLGDANKKLSNRSTLRFGDTGKIAVKIEGGSAGNWYDFSADKGGDLFTLVQEQQNTDFKGAAEYLKSYTGMSSGVERNNVTLVDDQRSSDNYAKYVQEQKYEAAKIVKAQKLYDSSREISARSIAAKYLSETRNIDPAASEIGSDIKTALVYDKDLGKKAPALIAFARSSEGDITGGQQIILDSSTLDKAKISVPKRSFGKISGSFVNLGYAGDNSEKSAITIIAEGIETGLSVKQALREHSEENGALIKTLCSLGINNIKNYQPSLGEKIIIAADNDGPDTVSNRVIEKAAKSLEEKGGYVEVVLPAREGDFNDVLKNTDKSAAIEEIRSDFVKAVDKLDAVEKTTFVDHINKPEARGLQDERSQVIENAPKQDVIAAEQELEKKPKNVMDQVQSSRLVEDIGEGLYKAEDTARQEDQSKALHSKPREYEYVADKYDNIYMDQVVGSYNYLRDTKEADVRGTHNFYGAYDFAGNVHTKIDSYLLAVGQNKNISALIDPKSEVGKEMNRLVAIEEAYQLDKTLPVKDRLSSTIMREIQENYQYLEDNFYEAKVKENQSIKIEDFSGNYHNDKSEYLHSVISDPQVQDKIDMGSEFGKVIEQELQRENRISYEKEIEIEP